MRVLFSILFVLVLLFPTGVWVTDLDFGINVDRAGIKAPLFKAKNLFDNDYYLACDQYFNDAFSLRGPLIYAKNLLDYHLFRTTYSREVHLGKNGWLYPRSSIADFRKEACNDRASAQRLALELKSLEKLLEASGRRFFFAVAPNKSTIYPEYVGFVPKGDLCDSSFYDIFLQSLAANPLSSFLRLDLLLREKKKQSAQLYDKTGTYWNNLGAKVVHKTVLERLLDRQLIEPAPRFQLLDAEHSGDLMDSLLGLSVSGADQYFRHLDGSGQPDGVNGVIYCDSSISNLLPYLANVFREVDVIQADRIPTRQYGEDLKSYEVILLVTAESELKNLHLELDQIFPALEAETLVRENHRLDLDSAVAVDQISLEARTGGLEIKSVGVDSIFELRSLPGSSEGISKVLKLSLESARPDTMTVEYMTNPPLHIHRGIKPGLTVMYLPLPFEDSVTLRINPGMEVGLFMLRSADVLSFSELPDPDRPIPDDPIVASAYPVQEEVVHQRSTTESEQAVQEIHVSIPQTAHSSGTAETQANETPQQAGKKPVPEHASIAVLDYEEGQIIQRRGRSADIVVSGTFTGHPDSIEARVIQAGSSEEVVPWTIVDAAPRNGIFLGVLRGVPQGAWYHVQVRHGSNHAIVSLGSHRWGVGMLVACIGQSNMKEWFHTGTDLEANLLLRIHTDKGWNELGNKGNGGIAFGNRLIERFGIPVGLLDYSVNGSGLRKEADWGTGYWGDRAPGSIYNRFLAGVSAVGGFVEFVIWMQGEADAVRGTVTEEEYRESLEGFISNQVRSDIGNGSDQNALPFLIISMIKWPGGENSPHQAIRDAQKQVARDVLDSYLAATTLDLKNQGRQHLSTGAYTTLGLRVAQTVLYILGKEKYYRGPSIAAVAQVDRRTIDVTLRHRGGADFTPASGISGWEVLADGTRVPLLRVFRYDAKTIRIELKRPIFSWAAVRYQYGAMPDAANPVRDDSEMALPLEEFHP